MYAISQNKQNINNVISPAWFQTCSCRLSLALMLDKRLPNPLSIAESLPKHKWISGGLTNGAAVGKRHRLRSPLPSPGLWWSAASVFTTFKPPTLCFQVLCSSELSTGHLRLRHPGSPLACREHDLLCWPAPSTTPTSSHRPTSNARTVPSFLSPCISSAGSLAPTQVSRSCCQFVNIPGLIQFIFINSLDEYVISPRQVEL